MRTTTKILLAAAAAFAVTACARSRTYGNPNMDFSSIRTVAVMPFWNLSKDPQGADRVRDVFQNALLATNAVYVVPTGEVARAVMRVGVATPVTPAADEVVKLCALLKVDAVITGVLKEYGEIRTAAASANVVALSLQMQEGSTGKTVWAASSSKGGIGWGERILGSAGGRPVNDVTEQVVDDLVEKLFK